MSIEAGAFWLLVWLFCAFGAAWIAESKGYSFGVWAGLGFLFGPFAVLVIGLVERADRNVSLLREREKIEEKRAKHLAASKAAAPNAPPSKDDGSKVYEIP